MRSIIRLATLPMIFWTGLGSVAGGDDDPPDGWRPLPLIRDGKVDPAWAQVGWGGFVVEDGVLRTECDEKGLGLLLYRAETFGNCQIRVVYRSKDAKSNAGVFVRPTMTAPADFRFATTGLSSAAIRSRKATTPFVVAQPA